MHTPCESLTLWHLFFTFLFCLLAWHAEHLWVFREGADGNRNRIAGSSKIHIPCRSSCEFLRLLSNRNRSLCCLDVSWQPVNKRDGTEFSSNWWETESKVGMDFSFLLNWLQELYRWTEQPTGTDKFKSQALVDVETQRFILKKKRKQYLLIILLIFSRDFKKYCNG